MISDNSYWKKANSLFYYLNYKIDSINISDYDDLFWSEVELKIKHSIHNKNYTGFRLVTDDQLVTLKSLRLDLIFVSIFNKSAYNLFKSKPDSYFSSLVFPTSLLTEDKVRNFIPHEFLKQIENKLSIEKLYQITLKMSASDYFNLFPKTYLKFYKLNYIRNLKKADPYNMIELENGYYNSIVFLNKNMPFERNYNYRPVINKEQLKILFEDKNYKKVLPRLMKKIINLGDKPDPERIEGYIEESINEFQLLNLKYQNSFLIGELNRELSDFYKVLISLFNFNKAIKINFG